MSKPNPPRKVIGLGLGVLDQLLLWRDMKAPVRENKIVDFTTQGGGMTATALVAVARLGGAAEFWGAVGTDWMGDLILQGLAQEGVDTSQVRRVDGARGPMVLVCVDQPTGERQFLYSTGLR
jgi:sulfofructose kinase